MRPLGGGQVVHGDVDRPAAGRRDRELGQPGRAHASDVRTFSIGSMCPSTSCSSGLTDRRRPEQRGRRADPPAAAQVLERVDVEDAVRGRRPAPRRLGDLVDVGTPPAAARPPDRTAKPSPMPSDLESTTSAGTGDSSAASRADS